MNFLKTSRIIIGSLMVCLVLINVAPVNALSADPTTTNSSTDLEYVNNGVSSEMMLAASGENPACVGCVLCIGVAIGITIAGSPLAVLLFFATHPGVALTCAGACIMCLGGGVE